MSHPSNHQHNYVPSSTDPDECAICGRSSEHDAHLRWALREERKRAEDIIITLTDGIRAQRTESGFVEVFQNADPTTPPGDWVTAGMYPPDSPTGRVILGLARLKDAMGAALAEALAGEERMRAAITAMQTPTWDEALLRLATRYARAHNESEVVEAQDALLEHVHPAPELVGVGAGAGAWFAYRDAAREVLRLNSLIAADIAYDEAAYRAALKRLADATVAFFQATGVA